MGQAGLGRSARGRTPADWPNRKLHEPGTHFKYNDVRVNVMALAALQVWRRPLPEVLREEIMEPIGASTTWRWYGYENSWVELDGQQVQSVTGGGHWGGGMFINALRHGAVRLPVPAQRQVEGSRSSSREKWIQMARTPGPANAEYGYANWYLNTGRKPLPSAPDVGVTFRRQRLRTSSTSTGSNDLVVVVRWISDDDALNEFLGKVIGAMTPAALSTSR